MIRVAICVEGDTEEAFVKKLLGPYLRAGFGVVARPINLKGDVRVERLARDMAAACRAYHHVTSLVDYYEFKGKAGRSVDELEAAVIDEVVRHLSGIRDRTRIFPYVQRHEFEALLFSDVATLGSLLNLTDRIVRDLANILATVASPEDINDNPNTAPSKRIKAVCPKYDKVIHGILLAREIGLERIRDACPRFGAWLTHLEKLGEQAI